jgi:potassium transporter
MEHPHAAHWHRARATVCNHCIDLFGAALIYGDGAITPAISVLSALEGLNITIPAIQPYTFGLPGWLEALETLSALRLLRPRRAPLAAPSQ